jgi:butyrate kinase
LKDGEFGNDKTNMAAVFIHFLKPKKAIISYPLTFDCLPETAKLSGVPQIERRMVAHTLDHLMAGEGKRVVSVYLSNDEISVCAQDDGNILDITNSYDGEGPITPTRSGFFQQRCPYKMAFSGKYSEEELVKKIRENGGLFSHLGTKNLNEVFEKIDNGDKKAELVYSAMLYTIHKEIGRKATALMGDFEEISLTGPLASNPRFVSDLRKEIKLTDKVILRNHSCPVAFLYKSGLLK